MPRIHEMPTSPMTQTNTHVNRKNQRRRVVVRASPSPVPRSAYTRSPIAAPTPTTTAGAPGRSGCSRMMLLRIPAK